MASESDQEIVAEGNGLAEALGAPEPAVEEELVVTREMELEVELAERTADLQRAAADFANYRRRMERDREVSAQNAVAKALSSLLPVLDDVDRARAHDDLTGAFKAVADKLEGALAAAGLEAFGTEGDEFDPAVHEAVTHDTSADVERPTTTVVMRKGYRIGDKLLRPAMVGVTAPE
ncbi:nucleotide exchange factor GrpE [Jatrophihabitans sp. YIM 134969]